MIDALTLDESADSRSGDPRLPWLIALAGFAAMYLPIYWRAAGTIWQTEEQAHEAIVLVVVLWLFWGLRKEIASAPTQPARAGGWTLFSICLLFFILGRIFRIEVFEFGTQPLIAAGLLLLLKGRRALRIAWFPVLYLIFMVPLPANLIDSMTGTLKGIIADIVESILFAADYPIARSGVILSIGPYQLQVADACSGLHSMFSLSALGTLFMYIMARRSKLHNAIMLLSILPIAFGANIIRVLSLVLITFYWGDEAGQGFLHGAAGMVLMLAALCGLFALDALLAATLRVPRTTRLPAEATS
jgi:exosortase B